MCTMIVHILLSKMQYFATYSYTELMQQHTMVAEVLMDNSKSGYFLTGQSMGLHFKERTVKMVIIFKMPTTPI